MKVEAWYWPTGYGRYCVWLPQWGVFELVGPDRNPAAVARNLYILHGARLDTDDCWLTPIVVTRRDSRPRAFEGVDR